MGFAKEISDRLKKGTPSKMTSHHSCPQYLRVHCKAVWAWALLTSSGILKWGTTTNTMELWMKQYNFPAHPHKIPKASRCLRHSPPGTLFESEVLCSLKSSYPIQIACQEYSNMKVFTLLSLPYLSQLPSEVPLIHRKGCPTQGLLLLRHQAQC